MWKASAVRASEWARKPEIISTKKNTVSMAIMILMRVLLESAILEAMVMDRRGSPRSGVSRECERDSSLRRIATVEKGRPSLDEYRKKDAQLGKAKQGEKEDG